MKPIADVCLILEGTYPFVSGGVSSWTHDLLEFHSDLRFHLVTLLPRDADLTHRFKVPKNVCGLEMVYVGKLPRGAGKVPKQRELFQRLREPLEKILSGSGLDHVAQVLRELTRLRGAAGSEVLLNSPECWELLLEMYQESHRDSSFLDYFWTWRALLSGLYSMLLAKLPPARLYHAVSTGYAGLFAARAHLETRRPVLLTEHGIYTNERKIEIGIADWLYQSPNSTLGIEKNRRDLRDVWVDTFTTYSHACYEAAARIITLYTGNQRFQLEDGADEAKLTIVPNGIDIERYSIVQRDKTPRPPTVALIGRVVPIKDVKTYIRAIGLLRGAIPDVQALVLGPTDEDPQYFDECKSLVNHLGLQKTCTFAGKVQLTDYLGKIDAIVLTSISEAQPLVILEAGAAGVPTVATDVGACREMIYGQDGDDLGPGGEVTPLADPTSTAAALARLLMDRSRWENCSQAIRERVRRSYNKPALDAAYKELYSHWCAMPDAAEKVA